MKNIILRLVFRLGPFFLFTLLTAFLFGRTLFPPDGQMIYGGDINDAYFYWKGYLRQTIREGTLPFWNPYNFSGTPFLAHPNINIFYPPNWLFVLLPPSYSFVWYFFLHILIAAISMYVLARDFTDRWGAAMAAIAYAWGGFFAARIYSGHLEYVDAASWVPLTLALLFRTIRKPGKKNTLIASLGVGILLLAGNELFFLFTMEIAGLYVVYQSIRYLTHRMRYTIILMARSILAFVIPVILGLGLAAIGLLPRLQFIRESIRSEGLPYGIAASGSLPFSGLGLFLWPYVWGNPFPEHYSYRGPWPNLFEFYHYVGVIPILLLFGSLLGWCCLRLLGAIKKMPARTKLDRLWRRGDLWFFLGTIVIFLLISFGATVAPSIHEALWRYTPLYKGIRFPARHLFVAALSLCIVCGIVIGYIRSRAVKIAVLLFLITDLFYTHKPFFRLTPFPTASHDQKLIEQLRSDTEAYRLLPDFPVVSAVRRDMDFGAAAVNGIQSTSDYNSMILLHYYRFIDAINTSSASSLAQFNVEIPPPNPASPWINFLNIKYILADRSYDLGIDSLNRYELVMDSQRYRLYRNPQHLPRFFVVHKASVFTDAGALERAIRGGLIDFPSEIAVSRDDAGRQENTEFPCHVSEKATAFIRSYEANRMVIDVDAGCDGFLSSSEVYYPGWQAMVDGKKVPVLRSNYAFRALQLPKGKHVVEYYYQPTIFWVGGMITLLSIIAIGYCWKRTSLSS